MRIVAFVADHDGCGFYRMMVPLQELATKRDVEVLVFDQRADLKFDDAKKEFVNAPPVLADDVLFLQRQTWDKILDYARWHKERGGKLVYELDDDFWNIPQRNHTRSAYFAGSPHLKVAEELLRISDAAIASTERLAEQMRKFCSNVHVAHNCLHEHFVKQFADMGEPPSSERILIGWAGSPTHEDDFIPIIRPIMDVLQARPNVRFQFIGADYRGLFPLSARIRMDFLGSTKGESVRRPSTIKYYELLANAGWHAAIAPIQNLRFNASKSYVKLLEYGMMGIPVVASDFGPYRQYASDWPVPTVIRASTPKDWVAGMLTLIDSAEVRSAYRTFNREHIAKRHMLEQRLPEWEAAFASLRSPVAV